ncbi:unnamed protein product [Rotaria sordida]|uniref:Innexin n=1 Tax=Rotaria sordida TaxID=392033 RepID=A0A815HDD2_9BILA|nr:unnamed protein product [Rotaria sordida]CAF1350839.1 unnamed protein product [Rotaria sordida]
MDKILIAEDRYGLKAIHLEEDDLIDRLNNRFTVLGLIMCISIIAGGVLVAEFKDPHSGYANSICWLKGSYYLPSEEITIPDRSIPRTYFVSYYQWTAFILLGMAMFFLLPQYIWHAFIRQSGVNTQRLIKTIKDQPDADKGVESAQSSLKLFLDAQYMLKGEICCGYHCSNFYLGYTIMYFTVKALYVINTMTQFFLLNTFLSFNFTSFGPQGINKIFTEGDWFESPRFPRVTMCDFMVRRLGSNQHWYAVQCTLPINMFNEKIFLGIWIWLIVLTILNILSIIPWIISLTRKQRLATIGKYLKMNKTLSEEKETFSSSTPMSPYEMHKFSQFIDYLSMDGFLIFYIIARNTDEIVAGKIIDHLYKNFNPPTRDLMSNV